MIVAAARIDLSLAGCRSLKDKRQIIRSLVERTRARFQVSIAEVEDQDLWSRAVLGIACVSGDGAHAQEVLQKAIRFIEDGNAEAEVTGVDTELLAPF